MSHWDSPLGVAKRCDKKRARAEKLRAEADRLDEEAAELERRYDELMAPHVARLAASNTGKERD